MGNCLKTQLKTVVNNDNLKKMDTIRLIVDSSRQGIDNRVRIMVSDSGKVIVTSNKNGYIATSAEELVSNPRQRIVLEPSTDNDIWVSEGNFNVDIQNRLNVRNITVRNSSSNILLDLSELEYATNILNISGQDCVFGDLSSLSKLTSMVVIGCSYNRITGDTSSLVPLDKIGNLTLNSTFITGTIVDFGYFKSLVSFDISNTNVGGSLEDFVAAQRLAGNTTKQITVGLTMFNSFNGENLPDSVRNKTLSWTPTTINYDGVTINA